jgi:two-component system KDP operon response regulator KdpE
MPAAPRILVVDDDPNILEMISMHLLNAGYQVMTARDGDQALAIIENEKPDLVLLDILMPSVDGLEVCEQVREYSLVPIIIISAVGHEDQKVKALDLGADDYLTKPFGVQELMARVRVALRRLETGRLVPPGSIFESGNLRINFLRRLVTVDGKAIHLTPIEYGLLRELAKNPDQVLMHNELLSQVWGPEYQDSIQYLHVYLGRLRRKLSVAEGVEIVTQSGVGYLLSTSST